MINWTLSRRLTAGFGAQLAVIVALVVCAMYSLKEIGRYVDAITTDNIPGLIGSSDAHDLALNYRILSLKHLLTNDPAEWRGYNEECQKLVAKTAKNLQEYEATITTATDRALFVKLEPALQAYRVAAEKMRTLNEAGDRAGALELMRTTVASTFSDYEKALIEIGDYNSRSGEENAAGIAATLKRAHLLSTVLAVIACAIGIGGAVLIIRQITRAIGRVTASLDEGSSEVAAAAAQVSSASQSLAAGSSEQASSLEETSASIEEMAAMTKRNADSAQQAKDLSGQTRRSADTGAAHMAEMREAMNAIKASSDDIAKIIKTIDEIAFQTNLLALNAAVEAARAGEAGMGFAVVAEEVRSLAQRSAHSAKETAGKIEDAIRKSEHGVAISANVATALADIVDKARLVDTLVAEIAQASLEQNQGIGQLNAAVGQMDKVTQANASNAEETAAAAQELTAQSISMRHSVAALETLIGGQAIGASAPAETDVALTSDRPAVSLQRPRMPVVAARSSARRQEPLTFADYAEATTTERTS